MIKTITFKKEYRCFKKGRTLKFRPGVNILVGDQGTGKSSLLQLLRDLASASKFGGYKREDAMKVIEVEVEGSNPVLAFDFEKDNPRIQSHFGDNIQMQVASMFASHGEVVRHILKSFDELKEPTIILFDEPDTGLSPRSVCRFRDDLKKAGENGHQVIVSAHSPIIIGAFEEVFSLEHKRWVASEKFLRDHGLTGESPWA